VNFKRDSLKKKQFNKYTCTQYFKLNTYSISIFNSVIFQTYGNKRKLILNSNGFTVSVLEDKFIFLNKSKKSDLIRSASSLMQIHLSVHFVELPETKFVRKFNCHIWYYFADSNTFTTKAELTSCYPFMKNAINRILNFSYSNPE
jgi:hypothetical protein